MHCFLLWNTLLYSELLLFEVYFIQFYLCSILCIFIYNVNFLNVNVFNFNNKLIYNLLTHVRNIRSIYYVIINSNSKYCAIFYISVILRKSESAHLKRKYYLRNLRKYQLRKPELRKPELRNKTLLTILCNSKKNNNVVLHVNM